MILRTCWFILGNFLPSERIFLTQLWHKFQYILIDEFQDINLLQYKLIRMLALPQNNIFIVGDDDQSIYGFRGARPEIMLNFEKDFSDVKKVFLSVNYRSQAAIVRGAGCVIKNNKQRFDKQIQAVRPEEEPVDIRVFKGPADENTAGLSVRSVITVIRDSVSCDGGAVSNQYPGQNAVGEDDGVYSI